MRRPDWWPRMEAVDWALVALFAGVLGLEILVVWMLFEGVL